MASACGNGMPLVDQVQRPRHRHRHQRDQRQVDAAADHDQAHRHAEDAEDGDAADQVQQVVRRQEAGQRHGEDEAQQQRQTEDDLLLAQAPQKPSCRPSQPMRPQDFDPRRSQVEKSYRAPAICFFRENAALLPESALGRAHAGRPDQCATKLGVAWQGPGRDGG